MKETRILLVRPNNQDIPELYAGIAQELDQIARYPHGKGELPRFIKNMMSKEDFIENFCGKMMFSIYEQDFLPLFHSIGMQVIERDYTLIEQHSIQDCGFDRFGGLGYWLRSHPNQQNTLGLSHHLADLQRLFFADHNEIHYVVLVADANSEKSIKELFVEDSIPFAYADLCYGADRMATMLQYNQKELGSILNKFVGYTLAHTYKDSKSTFSHILKPYSWNYLKQQLNVYFGAGWAVSLVQNPYAPKRISLSDIEQLNEGDIVAPAMHDTIYQVIAGHKKDIEKHGLIAG